MPEHRDVPPAFPLPRTPPWFEMSFVERHLLHALVHISAQLHFITSVLVERWGEEDDEREVEGEN